MKRLFPFVPIVAFLAACGGEPTAQLQGAPSFNQQGPTEISAAKTSEGQLLKTFPWTIEKVAETETLQLFEGDAAAARFTVILTRGDSVNVSSVTSEVCVDNAGESPTEGLEIVDQVQFHTGDENWQDLEDASASVVPDEQIPAGGRQCYSYNIPVAPQANGVYRNVAQVTITNFAGSEGSPAGVEVTAGFTLPDTLTGEANRSVNVEDSGGDVWLFEESGSETSEAVFQCNDDDGDNDNVATIVETGQTAEARVTVECYALDVSKTAETEFTRTYDWAVEKTSDTTSLMLARGVSWDVEYAVSVDTSGTTDGDAAVTGIITVANPAPMAAQVLGVTDVVSPDLALTVDCQVEFPVTIDAGAELACSYAGELPDVEERTNTATATLQNVTYDADGAATESGTTDFSGSETMVFGDPTAEQDACVSVSDDWYGALGAACTADELPAAFTYVSTLGGYDECGVFDETNTATFETSDNGVTDSAAWTVHVTVPCGPDCTLSQGYWKNHSEFGPAPYDATWAVVPDGASTPFFDSGSSWLHFFREPPKGGNSYVKLARQYMAAWLNGMRGANLAEVADDIQQAMDWLDQYDGDPETFDLDDKDLKRDFNQLQERLDAFNNGMVGPPKCEDDDDPDMSVSLSF